jgi:RecA/RadA recombinase
MELINWNDKQAADSTVVSIMKNSITKNGPKTMQRISTGSKSLDNLLCGGIETKTVTEFYGEYNSGKTQICHTLCTMAPRDKSQGGISGKSLYVDTEGNCCRQ